MNNKRILIDSLEYNYDRGPERREYETEKANEIAKIDNELYYIDETLSGFHTKKGSYESLKREINLTPTK